MSTVSKSKINQLLTNNPTGVVLLSSVLEQQGYSYALQNRYTLSNWLTSIGYGAYIRSGDRVDIFGGLYALQNLACIPHIGGRRRADTSGACPCVPDSGRSGGTCGRAPRKARRRPRTCRHRRSGAIHLAGVPTRIPASRAAFESLNRDPSRTPIGSR